ncbi:unnamed protein product, partial [Rotaria sordida]
NGITYDIEEYLAPASVLICSKCMAIGHFNKQCKELNGTCKICGISCPDLRQHSCFLVSKCVHYNGEHNSNALKCPIVKTFRAELTKKLLFTKISSSSTAATKFNRSNYHYDPANFPPLPNPQRWTTNTNATNSVVTKIDELINSMTKVNISLERLISKNDQY